ncbi:hypothetical protein CBI30_09595 [Polynucleobacter aenigmaticus]|uniref:SHOCT domain-containing protein n=1 Tax=Polynucleobacter aenigmaticus TaxID=1743164 RepID=A0A254PSC8_9BURK|nr:SHOCT domain-containing protein [Polynucleobacter aenigmaticus]OWS69419.1 hypothetical protein CBI30_09595 [Polynucleobacter aenigmaticus]
MNRYAKLALLAIGILLQVGCASITGSRNQPISVTSTHEGKPVTGAYCTLVNDKGTWFVNTPGSVVILKAYGDMSATCKKEETHVGVATFQSANEGAVWGNVLAGGLIGYAVDAGTGAGFSYPPTLNIEMIKGSTIPALPTGPQANAASSQASPGVIIETKSTTGTTAPSPARASIMPTTQSMPANDSPNPAKKLEDLNSMLKKGLITADEYNSKKAEILRNM